MTTYAALELWADYRFGGGRGCSLLPRGYNGAASANGGAPDTSSLAMYLLVEDVIAASVRLPGAAGIERRRALVSYLRHRYYEGHQADESKAYHARLVGCEAARCDRVSFGAALRDAVARVTQEEQRRLKVEAS